MRGLLEIAYTGVAAILLHPLRSLVTSAAVIAVLLPFVVGLGLSKGIERQAQDSIRWGADVYVTGKQFGRNVPLPLTALTQIEGIEGVTRVIPRIVGSVVLGKDREPAVLVGLPAQMLPASVTCVDGRLWNPHSMNEFVVGTELAQRLGLKVGALIPPFYRSSKGERVSKVVGIFKSDVSIWQSRLMFTSFETAGMIFDQEGVATDVLVFCRPGYRANVGSEILQNVSLSPVGADSRVSPRVIAKEELQVLLPRGLLHREGIFNLHFVLAFSVTIGVILVTSGIGLSERRREIGILKAVGWQTDEILLRSMVESFLLSLSAASISLLLGFVWLKWLNGYWIASIFLAGVGVVPSFQVPFRLTPIPALICFLISLAVVATGSLYSTWRAATAAPVEAMR